MEGYVGGIDVTISGTNLVQIGTPYARFIVSNTTYNTTCHHLTPTTAISCPVPGIDPPDDYSTQVATVKISLDSGVTWSSSSSLFFWYTAPGTTGSTTGIPTTGVATTGVITTGTLTTGEYTFITEYSDSGDDPTESSLSSEITESEILTTGIPTGTQRVVQLLRNIQIH